MGSREEEEEVSVTRSIKLPVTLDIALRNIKDAKVVFIFLNSKLCISHFSAHLITYILI